MKLYNSMGPNPQMVRMYAAELGIELILEEIDLMAGENRQSLLPQHKCIRTNARTGIGRRHHHRRDNRDL